jgi:predicted DNA-binding antitoxin AbrB/MazE fold protein
MVREVKAIYENGTLRLLEPVDLNNGEKVTVTVDSLTPEARRDRLNAVLDRIAAQIVCRDDDHFSGADHDKVLYGEPDWK